MSEFKLEQPPEGLSQAGRYLFYKCQMEMYRRSLGIPENTAQHGVQWTAGFVAQVKSFFKSLLSAVLRRH